MATVSRFGSKRSSSSSHRSIENIVADVSLSEAVKSQVADLCAKELSGLDKKINELVGKEFGELNKKIDDYIKSKNVLIAKPNVVDFGNRRLTHVKKPT